MISNENYDLIAEEHLNDPNIYEKFEENPMENVLSSINDKLINLLNLFDTR